MLFNNKKVIHVSVWKSEVSSGKSTERAEDIHLTCVDELYFIISDVKYNTCEISQHNILNTQSCIIFDKKYPCVLLLIKKYIYI